jgi:ABC-2 type transport system ATP-binding protein
MTAAAEKKIDGDAPQTTALRVEGLVKRYGDLIAVNGVDLEVRAGECFGLLGPNGAGKTTTVEILEGLTVPDAGTVEIFGMQWRRGRDQILREHLGVQLQETNFGMNLTVEETVRLFRSFFRRGRAVEEVLHLVALEEKRKARVGKLSGGQKQRLAIACALVGDPRLIFLDEPTTGLDPQARLKLWEIVEEFRAEGGTILLTTHYMEEAARLCDRLAVMDHGKIIALGTPRELIASLDADQVVEFSVRGTVDETALAKLPGVGRVRSDAENHYVVSVKDIGLALPALLAELRRENAELIDLTTHQATLEDVFVHLTGRHLRG